MQLKSFAYCSFWRRFGTIYFYFSSWLLQFGYWYLYK